MPSEVFKRQVYATFWFEHKSLKPTIEEFQDNVMFASDFPHPTCLAPGAGYASDSVRDHIEKTLSDLPESILRKILYENAARLYHLT
jgi:predicted TIM-barrel fold metal-dependent hydrolase